VLQIWNRDLVFIRPLDPESEKEKNPEPGSEVGDEHKTFSQTISLAEDFTVVN
jgi:hypothetical protein